jgi:hypothetical protein
MRTIILTLVCTCLIVAGGEKAWAMADWEVSYTAGVYSYAVDEMNTGQLGLLGDRPLSLMLGVRALHAASEKVDFSFLAAFEPLGMSASDNVFALPILLGGDVRYPITGTDTKWYVFGGLGLKINMFLSPSIVIPISGSLNLGTGITFEGENPLELNATALMYHGANLADTLRFMFDVTYGL